MSDPDALAELRHHWGEAYEISYRAGQYRAVRRDDGSMIRRDDPAGLLEEIRRDYAVRPVPRHCPAHPWRVMSGRHSRRRIQAA